jgi:uncharacterized beta-barrel protein YwiB (DUF1934 family)
MLSVISTLGENGMRNGDAETNETTYKGKLTENGNTVTLTYRDSTEGGDARCEITVSGDEVKVVRRGAIASDMIFREGEVKKSLYKIPPHAFDMEIFCKKAKVQIGHREGRVDLLYNMTLGGESRSARMRITWN